jgi:hypothetical protein
MFALASRRWEKTCRVRLLELNLPKSTFVFGPEQSPLEPKLMVSILEHALEQPECQRYDPFWSLVDFVLIPANYQVIVTLGPGLTKDRLAQGEHFLFFPPFFGLCGSSSWLLEACICMQKLGKGQSIVFCTSMKVHHKIIESRGKSQRAIEVADVLKWCIGSMCTHTRKCILLWAT